MVESKRLCLICPTRCRPDLFTTMVGSVAQTASEVDLIAVVDEDDPQLPQYCRIAGAHPFVTLETNRQPLPFMRHYNRVFRERSAYAYYSCTNDDFVYQTPHWDQILMREIEVKFGGLGWAYGDDLYQGAKLPTTSVVSGDICRALGWVQMPWLNRCFGDDAVLALGNAMGRISYVASVVIEHRHPSIGKNAQDDTYLRSKRALYHHRDKLAFRLWKWFRLGKDRRLIERRLL